MPTINFFIQGIKNPTGIFVRLREGTAIDAKARTKFAVNPNDWSTAKRYLKHTKDESLKSLDQELQHLKIEILNAFNNTSKGDVVNSQWLKMVLDPTKNSVIPQTLVEYFDYYREKQKHNIEKRSYQKLSVVKNFIVDFERKINKKHLISDVNEAFMQRYLEVGFNNGYSQNYLARNFKFIKTICYDAEIKGIKIDPQLRRLKIKEVPTQIIYLTLKEIDAIKNVKLEREALINARDWLIISCETAQRVSDFLGYTDKSIRYQKNNKGKLIPLLEFTQKKTKKIMTIPLSNTVMEILISRNGKFPKKISDQRYNEYIKDVCKEAKINEIVEGAKQDPQTHHKISGKFPKYELVTSHIGRRSFASNNYGLIPTTLIMAMTGHKNEKEFLKYIGKSESSLALQLAEYID